MRLSFFLRSWIIASAKLGRTRPLGVLLVFLAAGIGGRSAPLNEAAENLVQRLDLKNTDYRHGQWDIDWKNPPHCFTDCSGFLDALLLHVYHFQREDLHTWLGSARPNAAAYYEAIAGNKDFLRIDSVEKIQPGDVLAVKYLHRTDNSGHIMIADGTVQAVSSHSIEAHGAREWQLAIIDCSESGHGPQDTRHHLGEGGKDHAGLGRGILRIYSDEAMKPIGFSWSTLKVSPFKGSETEPLVIGRLQIVAHKE